MARSVKQKQQALPFRQWGGARKGAGRPKKPGAKLRHARRAAVPARYPAHVTLRTLRALKSPREVRNAICYVLRNASYCTSRLCGRNPEPQLPAGRCGSLSVARTRLLQEALAAVGALELGTAHEPRASG